MRVLIVSDTHGRDDNLIEVVKRERPIDKIVHLGDIGGLEDYIEQITDCVCFCVRGNNDWRSNLPAESIIMIGNHRAFITHGHYYGVSYSNVDVVRHARSLDCDIVMYGHTHIPEIDEGKITILNPGSLTSPRQPGRRPSYIIAETDDNDKVTYTLKYL